MQIQLPAANINELQIQDFLKQALPAGREVFCISSVTRTLRSIRQGEPDPVSDHIIKALRRDLHATVIINTTGGVENGTHWIAVYLSVHPDHEVAIVADSLQKNISSFSPQVAHLVKSLCLRAYLAPGDIRLLHSLDAVKGASDFLRASQAEVRLQDVVPRVLSGAREV